MGYEINYAAGEGVNCSSKIVVADRIFYVKLFSSESPKFFSGDQQGLIQKEISETEFELWITILSDKDADSGEILKKVRLGKKY
jgi:hypothetical protein